MTLVLNICEYLYVLDAGSLIFEGAPDDVRTSELVKHAYLGTDDTSVLEAVGIDDTNMLEAE
jgi:ABC-type lipopolysaccharide export system ATPase subunit